MNQLHSNFEHLDVKITPSYETCELLKEKIRKNKLQLSNSTKQFINSKKHLSKAVVHSSYACKLVKM